MEAQAHPSDEYGLVRDFLVAVASLYAQAVILVLFPRSTRRTRRAERLPTLPVIAIFLSAWQFIATALITVRGYRIRQSLGTPKHVEKAPRRCLLLPFIAVVLLLTGSAILLGVAIDAVICKWYGSLWPSSWAVVLLVVRTALEAVFRRALGRFYDKLDRLY